MIPHCTLFSCLRIEGGIGLHPLTIREGLPESAYEREGAGCWQAVVFVAEEGDDCCSGGGGVVEGNTAGIYVRLYSLEYMERMGLRE
jgi:hypothetical protein